MLKKKKTSFFIVFLMDPLTVADNVLSFVVHIWGLCCGKTAEHTSFPALTWKPALMKVAFVSDVCDTELL